MEHRKDTEPFLRTGVGGKCVFWGRNEQREIQSRGSQRNQAGGPGWFTAVDKTPARDSVTSSRLGASECERLWPERLMNAAQFNTEVL